MSTRKQGRKQGWKQRWVLHRYLKFITVGALNALVDLFVLNLLLMVRPTRSVEELSLYNTLAVGAAVLNSYFWNRRWTFRDLADSSRRQRMLFWVQAAFNVLLNDLITVWLSLYLTSVKSLPLFLGSNLAKGLAMFLSSSGSYLLLKFVIFSQHGTSYVQTEQAYQASDRPDRVFIRSMHTPLRGQSFGLQREQETQHDGQQDGIHDFYIHCQADKV